jgi:hypothetical protein
MPAREISCASRHLAGITENMENGWELEKDCYDIWSGYFPQHDVRQIRRRKRKEKQLKRQQKSYNYVVVNDETWCAIL